MNRPRSLKQLWSEEDLCKRLGLKTGKGHSVLLGRWIREGLKSIKISHKRFFWEQDIIDFLVKEGSDFSEGKNSAQTLP
jgi:hypothetical protein